MALFLTNCQIIVKTNEYTMPKLSINLVLLQGLPLFFIFYLFYNGDLFDDCAKKKWILKGTLIILPLLLQANW